MADDLTSAQGIASEGGAPSSSTSPPGSPLSTGSNGASASKNNTSDDSRRASIRALISTELARYNFASQTGLSFGGKRDLYQALGYQRILETKDYKARYARGGITKRLVKVYPEATWSSGADIIEDPDPDTETKFEKAVSDLFARLNIWQRFYRADIAAQLGRYSILLLGAPGRLEDELKLSSSDDLIYLTALAEDRAKIGKLVDGKDQTDNPRFGLPEYYDVKISGSLTTKVHWSRVIHFADGLLEDDVYGEPYLEDVWNYLDDLDKVIGGGSEAVWQRQAPGMHVDVDKDIPFGEAEQTLVQEEIEDFMHHVNPWIRTQGAKVTPIASSVTSFHQNADAITTLISGCKRIPKRILLGSERGELASSQDRDNFNDGIADRRRRFAVPIVEQFIDRMIDFGGLPEVEEYEIIWPEEEELSEAEKADVIVKIAKANFDQFKAEGRIIMSSDEIRDLNLDLEPLEIDVEETREEVEDVERDEDLEDDDDEDEGNEDESAKSRAASQLPQLASNRVVLIGGPRRGKSSVARQFLEKGIPTFCGDPKSLVKDVEEGVTYLPEGLSWSESSQYIADNWLTLPGPWCIEGIATARALRKIVQAGKLETLQGIDILVIHRRHTKANSTEKQEVAAKGVETVWNEIKGHFPNAVELDKPLPRVAEKRVVLRKSRSSIDRQTKIVGGQRYRAIRRPIVRMG